MNIIAIDPGTSNTGVVYMSELSIVCFKTISGKPVYTDQYELMERMESITRQILVFMADKPHEAVVIEGFLGYKGRNNAFTFQTPQLIGFLEDRFLGMGENVIVQTSDEVLNPRRRDSLVCYDDSANGKARAKEMALKRTGWRDVDKLPNDHVRAAALHGIYYYKRKEEGWER